MRARNKIYHPDCFCCESCSRQLVSGDEFALRDEHLFCKLCIRDSPPGSGPFLPQEQPPPPPPPQLTTLQPDTDVLDSKNNSHHSHFNHPFVQELTSPSPSVPTDGDINGNSISPLSSSNSSSTNGGNNHHHHHQNGPTSGNTKLQLTGNVTLCTQDTHGDTRNGDDKHHRDSRWLLVVGPCRRHWPPAIGHWPLNIVRQERGRRKSVTGRKGERVMSISKVHFLPVQIFYLQALPFASSLFFHSIYSPDLFSRKLELGVHPDVRLYVNLDLFYVSLVCTNVLLYFCLYFSHTHSHSNDPMCPVLVRIYNRNTFDGHIYAH